MEYEGVDTSKSNIAKSRIHTIFNTSRFWGIKKTITSQNLYGRAQSNEQFKEKSYVATNSDVLFMEGTNMTIFTDLFLT